METNFEKYGIECGSGWHKLLEPVFEYIEQYNKEHEEKIEVLQVKEKFGGLRFYTNFHTEELRKLIEEAEDKAYKTCELCGSTENTGRTGGWITTCCKECAMKMAARRNVGDLKWKPNN